MTPFSSILGIKKLF